MSWAQCSKKRRAVSQRKPFITHTKETLAGSLIILVALIGIFMTFCLGQNSDKNIQGTPRGNFLERAATPASSKIYQLKKVERNGKGLVYVMKIDKKGNLSSNKNHPTRTPMSVSFEK